MSKYAKRVDANQAEIVKALRAAGYTVLVLSGCGQGVPDCSVLIDSNACLSLFLEIKDGDKVPSAQKLTDAEEIWQKNHGWNTRTVNSVESALAAVVEFKRGTLKS